MKIIIRNFLTYFGILILISISISNGTYIGNTFSVVLYTILVIWLKKISSTYENNDFRTNTIKEVRNMFILTFIVFLCSTITEMGLTSYFIPNYSDNFDMNKIEIRIIIGIVLVLFMVICAHFGLSVGSALGELIYNNLKH